MTGINIGKTILGFIPVYTDSLLTVFYDSINLSRLIKD